MKKLLFLFAFATLAACNTEEGSGDQTPKSANFGGKLIVTDQTQNPPQTMTSENVTYQLNEENGVFVLTMPGIQFVPTMPPLSIAIPKLTSQKEGDTYRFTSTVTPIVPYMGGKPYSDFQINGFECVLRDNTLTVEFNCSADTTLPNGKPLLLNHDTSFTGKLLL